MYIIICMQAVLLKFTLEGQVSLVSDYNPPPVAYFCCKHCTENQLDLFFV